MQTRQSGHFFIHMHRTCLIPVNGWLKNENKKYRTTSNRRTYLTIKSALPGKYIPSTVPAIWGPTLLRSAKTCLRNGRLKYEVKSHYRQLTRFFCTWEDLYGHIAQNICYRINVYLRGIFVYIGRGGKGASDCVYNCREGQLQPYLIGNNM
jgi:hypothetical protein